MAGDEGTTQGAPNKPEPYPNHAAASFPLATKSGKVDGDSKKNRGQGVSKVFLVVVMSVALLKVVLLLWPPCRKFL